MRLQGVAADAATGVPATASAASAAAAAVVPAAAVGHRASGAGRGEGLPGSLPSCCPSLAAVACRKGSPGLGRHPAGRLIRKG